MSTTELKVSVCREEYNIAPAGPFSERNLHNIKKDLPKKI